MRAASLSILPRRRLETDREPSGPQVSREPEGSRSRASRCARLVAGVLALTAFAIAPALAGPPPGRGAVAEPAPLLFAPAKSPEPQRRLTKFEARRIRHACYGRADERGLSGPERAAFLARCYFGRVSQRAERRQCRQLAAARGVEKPAMREFVRECVRELLRRKAENNRP